MLMVMDVAYIRAIQEKDEQQIIVAEDPDHKEIKEPVYKRPLSPDLFDAMFVNVMPKEQ